MPNGEDRIQAAIVSWVRIECPDLVCFSVANGGLRTKSEAAKLKWTGLLASVPDLVVAGLRRVAHFLEV